MLRISSSGFTVKLVQSREEPAQLRIVIIDALMKSEQPGAQIFLQFVSHCHAPVVSCNVSHNDYW